jgi:WD40 repeat protein
VKNPELACWVDFTPDGQRVVSHGAPDLVRVWDVSNGEALGEFHLPPDSAGSYHFAFAGASDWLYAVGWSSGMSLAELNLTTGALKPLCGVPAPIRSLACSRSRKWLALACGRDRVMTWYLRDPDEE